jgi:hypothetical protein
MNKRFGLGLVLVAAMIAGCGDDGGSTGGAGGGGTGGSAPQGTLNESGARQSSTTAIGGANTAVSGDGTKAALELFPLGTSALGLVQPAGAGPQNVELGETGSVKQAVQTGVCECMGETCHFEACGDTDWGSDLTITGDISWTGGNVVADLNYMGTSSDGVSTYEFGVTMDVQVGSGTIDGTVGTTGSITTQGFGNTWDATIVFNQVGFNDSGCALSGSIDVTATSKISIQESTASSTITFDGSGC